MYWLNMNWITENWAPLLITLVIGYVIGWLLTGMPPARRARDLEARNADLEGNQRKSDRELTDLRSDNTKVRNSLTTALADLEAARNDTKSLEAKVAALEAAAAEVSPTEEMPAIDAAAADAIAEESDAAEAVAAGGTAALMEQTVAPALAPDQVAERFAAIARTPEAIEAENAREVALKEAIGRAARLQEELDQRETLLSARHAELESLKVELLTSNAARHELDNRLVRAREDVASELAVLASTMIKMKDDALARADARNAALKAELDAVRTELDTARSGQPAAAE